jgi:hypothetical protein
MHGTGDWIESSKLTGCVIRRRATDGDHDRRLLRGRDTTGSFGRLVVEAEGWHSKQLIRVTDQDVERLWTVDGRGRVERQKNPIRQVREYLHDGSDERKATVDAS